MLATFFNVMPTGTMGGLYASINGLYNLTTPVWTILFVTLIAIVLLALFLKLFNHK